ncbi:MAG TPA: ATP-binding protein [Gemmatimonadaceae bacterium]|nr:ATP-binding protein [Gemmatimonadaceae bacterium]
MRLPYSLSRLRPASVALALVLLFALAGLFAVDRTIAASNRNRVTIESVQSAAIVESFLAVHAEALQSMRGLFLDTSRAPDSAHFRSLALSLSEYAASFQRIWISDASGRITNEHVFGDQQQRLGPGFDVDTALAFSLARITHDARVRHRAQVSPPDVLLSGKRGILLIDPIYVGEEFRGFAGGGVTADAIVERLKRGRPTLRGRVLIVADADTIARTGPEPRAFEGVSTAITTFNVPGGDQWQLIVERPSTYVDVRILLWAVGLATLGTLILVLLHEHNQNERLTERSTELERLSSELLRANRVKSEFLANVSHELRTPLNAIVGFVELLHDGVYGELTPRQMPPVDRITSSANHLRQLVDQILDLAKMAAGRLEVHIEPLDLRAMVLDVASEVESLISERELNFSIAVGNSLPRVRTDPMHLRQILMNLLSNAIKFTPAGGGGVAIRARLITPRAERLPMFRLTPPSGGGPRVELPPFAHRGTWIALQVADSGLGISPSDHERIFDEFEQVNAGPRGDSMQRGTGLGLPISRRLARLMGGDITVASELGKGATFTLWLPVDQADLAAANESEITTEPRHAGSSS